MAVHIPIDEYPSDLLRPYLQRGRDEGLLEGRSKAVLAVLDARGIAVPDDVRDRVVACTDLDRLDVLIRRAIVVRAAADLFDPTG